MVPSAEDLENLRQVFLDGQQATSRGRYSTAEDLHTQLVDANYALAPYLEMSLLIARANRVDNQEILDFMGRYSGTWLAEKLRLNWLNTLRSVRNYQGYVDNFIPGTGNKIQQCYYLEALYRLDRIQEAYAGATKMWLVGTSQPDQCDYTFDRWRRSDQFSEEYIWQRYILARREGEVRFSNYLANLVIEGAIGLRIRAYQTIRSKPEILENVETFVSGGISYSAVIAQGLRNLAAKNLSSALSIWPSYRDASIFTQEDLDYSIKGLIEQLIDSGRTAELYQFAVENRAQLSEQAFEDGALLALADTDWQSLLNWLDLMPSQQQEQIRWIYWRGRSLNQIGLSGSQYYDQIRNSRDYYGFLASLLEDNSFSLNEQKPDLIPEISEDQIKAWQRAGELERVEYFNNSRLTWVHANDELDTAELLAASSWAASEDLDYLSIQAAITAKSWDFLELRFPTPYLEAYQSVASEFDLSLSWLYALSRQESAFARDITSGAGAKGLMQLMPRTARETAHKLGIRYDQDLLSDAEYNTRLGGSYLQQAYLQLEENPIYASAAYNAGISRVKGWLRNGRDQLPLDVWVEIIPFQETKKYVQNLMAFAVIYADKLGQSSPLQDLDSAFFIPNAN
jgi:soluble lytic murein transglycosylase